MLVLSLPVSREIRSRIRTVIGYPTGDFPFADIGTALCSPGVLRPVTVALVDALRDCKPDAIVGIEARGLVFGAPIAATLDVGFVMARKAGRLPGICVSEHYENEYGEGQLEISTAAVQSGARCIVVDDFLATGGTASAASRCIAALGAEVVAFAFFIEDRSMDGREKLGNVPVFAAVEF